MMKMPEKHYCLRWNNHQPNFISTFSSLLTDECLVDVTLAAEGEYVQAHKIVLSACSAYFRKLFSINPCQHPIVVLKDVTLQDLKSIISFMYHGEVNVNQEHLESVLKTAVALNIKGLADLAVTFSRDKKESNQAADDFQSPATKRKRLKKSSQSQCDTKNVSSEVEILGINDLTSKSENYPANTSGSSILIRNRTDQKAENDGDKNLNLTCSTSNEVLIRAPTQPVSAQNQAGISVIIGAKKRGRLLIRQDNVLKASDNDDDDDDENNSELSESRRSLIRQYSDPTPRQNQSASDSSPSATTKKSKFLTVTNPHLQKQNSDSALSLPRDQPSSLLNDLINDPIKFEYSQPKSNHCPSLRPGPPVGCNYCWNTIDMHGRILRRKTKYHCPECRTNLCIVPCFQDYHSKKNAENEDVPIKQESIEDSGTTSSSQTSGAKIT